MNNLNINKSNTIAFTGHRHIHPNDVQRVKEELINLLSKQYHNGYKTFITGAAVGFDLLAAEAVLELQMRHSDIQFFCAVPYAGHHRYFKDEDIQRYIRIADKATSNIILSSHYYNGCFLRRNDYMLNNCSLLIAYYNGSFRSGTAYTVRRAASNNIPTTNLYK